MSYRNSYRGSHGSGSRAVCKSFDSDRYMVSGQNARNGTLTKVSTNVASTATRNSQSSVQHQMVEQVKFRNGEVVKVSRFEHSEQTSFTASRSNNSSGYRALPSGTGGRSQGGYNDGRNWKY